MSMIKNIVKAILGLPIKEEYIHSAQIGHDLSISDWDSIGSMGPTTEKVVPSQLACSAIYIHDIADSAHLCTCNVCIKKLEKVTAEATALAAKTDWCVYRRKENGEYSWYSSRRTFNLGGLDDDIEDAAYLTFGKAIEKTNGLRGLTKGRHGLMKDSTFGYLHRSQVEELKKKGKNKND